MIVHDRSAFDTHIASSCSKIETAVPTDTVLAWYERLGESPEEQFSPDESRKDPEQRDSQAVGEDSVTRIRCNEHRVEQD